MAVWAWVSVHGACAISRGSQIRIQSSVPELRMLRFPKPETMCERQGRPSPTFVCAHGHVVDNTAIATNPGHGGGG